MKKAKLPTSELQTHSVISRRNSCRSSFRRNPFRRLTVSVPYRLVSLLAASRSVSSSSPVLSSCVDAATQGAVDRLRPELHQLLVPVDLTLIHLHHPRSVTLPPCKWRATKTQPTNTSRRPAPERAELWPDPTVLEDIVDHHLRSWVFEVDSPQTRTNNAAGTIPALNYNNLSTNLLSAVQRQFKRVAKWNVFKIPVLLDLQQWKLTR